MVTRVNGGDRDNSVLTAYGCLAMFIAPIGICVRNAGTFRVAVRSVAQRISRNTLTKESLMKIDIFCHIFPQNFYDRMRKLPESGIKMRSLGVPAMVDLDVRFRMMDRFGDYVQVVSLASPPLEALGDAKHSPELAQIANDGLAELVQKHPDRFPGFVAGLPMNNPKAAVEEIERAVMKLGATGVQFFSNVNGKPLDDPEFLPIFEKMAEVNLQI